MWTDELQDDIWLAEANVDHARLANENQKKIAVSLKLARDEIHQKSAEGREKNAALTACRTKLNKLYDATGGVYHGGMEHSQLIAWIVRLTAPASDKQRSK